MSEKIDVSQLIPDNFDSIKQTVNPHAKKVLSKAFTGMQGRYTRLKIIKNLAEKPMNTHQLTKELLRDYKAIQRNLKVLEKNNLVIKIGEKYGSIYYISPFLEANIIALKEIIKKVEQKLGSKKSIIK